MTHGAELDAGSRSTRNNSGTPDFLSTRELAEFLGLHQLTLVRWRREGEGTGPRFVRFGFKVRYPRTEVERWIAANTDTATNAA